LLRNPPAWPLLLLADQGVFSAHAGPDPHDDLERTFYETICDAQSNISNPYSHSQPLLIQLFEWWEQLNIVLPLTTSSLSFATSATNNGLVLRHSP